MSRCSSTGRLSRRAAASLTYHGDALASGTNTHLLGIDRPRLNGAPRCSQLSVVRLSEDTHHVTAAVHPTVAAEWHRVDRAWAFRVSGGVHQDGLVAVQPQADCLPGLGVRHPAEASPAR